METIRYKGHLIKSTPQEILDKAPNKYSVHGIICIDCRNDHIEVLPPCLNIPDDQWLHRTANEADQTYIKYAKIYIDRYNESQHS